MQSSVLETAGQGPAALSKTLGKTMGREGTVLLVYSEQKKKHYIIVKPACR
jgi:hypothetical protein